MYGKDCGNSQYVSGDRTDLNHSTYMFEILSGSHLAMLISIFEILEFRLVNTETVLHTSE
jgi:hypothetical protein